MRFSLRTSGDSDHEGCYLSVGHNQPLEDCGFNVTAKTFFIIHGWTVSPGEGALPLDTRFGFLCFGQLKRRLVLPDSALSRSPPLFLWLLVLQTAVKNVMGTSLRGQCGLQQGGI